MTFNEWLNAPIPRKQVLSGISMMVVGQAIREWGIKKQGELALKDAEERFEIMKETTLFLLDRADTSTHVELNEKLDFWRIIRGVPTEKEEK